MTIDWKTVSRAPQEYVFTYTWKDVVLYALGIGAQTDELSFIYEDAPGGLQVFPSFATKASGKLLIDFSRQVEGFRFLHGEQGIRLHRPIPPEGKIMAASRVADVYDKGKAAVIRFLTEGRTEEGALLFDVEHIAFHVGAGGFGGDPGPKSELLNPPDGVAPDFQIAYPIPANQAALYRLNGDLNPLHLDPEFARRGGFDRPILHGLCHGDVSRFKEFKARFSGAVYPGETLTTEGWRDSAGRYLLRARTERAVVLSNAYAVVGT
jgi:acyl dehydratase